LKKRFKKLCPNVVSDHARGYYMTQLASKFSVYNVTYNIIK